MAKTREIRKRISSVRNINKITRTMEKVAQSKIMKLNTRFADAKAFRASLLRLLPEALGAAVGTSEANEALARQPLTEARPKGPRVMLLAVTSSRGLCGGYNAKVIAATRARMQELAREGRRASLAVLGRKGLSFFRYNNQPVEVSLADIDENVPFLKLRGGAGRGHCPLPPRRGGRGGAREHALPHQGGPGGARGPARCRSSSPGPPRPPPRGRKRASRCTTSSLPGETCFPRWYPWRWRRRFSVPCWRRCRVNRRSGPSQ